MNKPFSPTAPRPAADGAEASLRAKFGHVDAWVFDLDNTLYPSDSDLWPNIDKRITLFLMTLFGLDGLSARALQKHYYQRHGTTLRGLIDEDLTRPEEFLAFVHDIDRSTLRPDPSLAEQIAALPGRKLIFTNGSRDHALRTAAQLGMERRVRGRFRHRRLEHDPEAGRRRLCGVLRQARSRSGARRDVRGHRPNLAVPRALGMTTTLVKAKVDRADHREAHDRAVEDAGAIDFSTSDLADFLTSVNAGLRGG